MTPKEQVLKMIEGRIDTMQKLALESIDLIYKAAYNEAIDDAYKIVSETTEFAKEILTLKKE